MTIRTLTRYETRWIAQDACYVYTDGRNKVHRAALTYGLVHRRMLERIDDDMMHALVAHDGTVHRILASAWGGLASVVHQMDWLTWLVVNNEGNAFDFERRGDGKLIRVEENALGRYYSLLFVLVRAVFDGELNLDRFRLTPYAELFRDVVRYYVDKIPILIDCFGKLPTFFDTDVRRFCGELANDLFFLLRQEARRRRVDGIVTALKDDGNRTIASMQMFKSECFARHPELNVMPLECAYFPSEGVAPVSLERAKRDHARFVNRLRGNAKIGAVAIGGIWSLAWGEHKGHHFRWIFMLDASLVPDSSEWAEFVGSVWKNAVPDDAACVRVPGMNDAPSPVGRIIRADDAVGMKVLDDELEYHALKDNFIQFKEAAGARSWGTWVPANTRIDRRRC